MTEKRSPWFNARRQPPVNGGHASEYEWKCDRVPNCKIERLGKNLLREYGNVCPECQWRGLLREDGGGKSVA